MEGTTSEAPPRRKAARFATPRPQRLALLIWLAGLVVSGALAAWAHEANRTLFEERLGALSDEVAALVSERLGLYEYGLRGTRGAVVAAGGAAVTRAAFSAYIASRDLPREFPGALGLGFIRRVPRADEASFLAAARAEGPSSFAIRELGPNAGERFVIQYIYPLDTNQGATGLDVASEANRREAAMAAAQEGRAKITKPVTLVQAGEQPRRGFLVYLPVYATGAPTHTPEARVAANIGWAYAPLVIDQVLAGMGTRMQQIAVRLTDSAETTVFFDSLPGGTRVLPGVPEATREIAMFGRRWILQARALPALAEASRPLSVGWVFLAGAAGSTLVALLAWLILQRRAERAARFDHPSATPVTLRRFLRSPQLRGAALAYLGFLAIYLVLQHRAEWTRQLGDARRSLTTLVDERAAMLRAAQQARRKALNFLAAVPPIEGLARALPGGVDPVDGSSREMWEQRMRQILQAHLKTSPEVYRARLVGVADGGRELVRVERRGSEIVAVPASELQQLGDHPDVKQALRLQADEVWVSDMDLNRELGRLEQPHRPTIRYATPTYRADGQAFAVLLVHVDVAPRLTDAAARAGPTDQVLYITNAAGDFLRHPDPARSLGADPGHRRRWSDEFQPAAGPEELGAHDRLQVWRGDRGLVVAASAFESPNPQSAVGTIRYVAVLPLVRIEAGVWSALGESLVLPLATGAGAMLLLFFYWASVQRQLQVRDQRSRLAAIVDQSMDAIVGLDADQRITAWNRGAERLFAIGNREAMGRPLFELVGVANGTAAWFDASEGAGRWQAGEFECTSRDGRPLRIAMTWSRLGDGYGSAASAVLRDVTDERAAQARIVELNRGLEQQVRERTEMLDVLAHEVRQPLQNASAAMESARSAFSGSDREDPRSLIQRAQAVLVEVQRSVDNTLAVASLLARPDPIHLDDADIDTLISVVIADMPAAERGRIEVQRDTATRTVLMDPSLMRLALRNLLWNALKFSPPGSTVQVRLADSDAPLGLHIDVIDRGSGVPPEVQPRLFTRGARGSGKRAGHGLGLYLVHQVMALHESTVELARTGPEGSVFRLTIVQGDA